MAPVSVLETSQLNIEIKDRNVDERCSRPTYTFNPNTEMIRKLYDKEHME